MISICIPIYNFNVIELVSKLSIQSKNLEVPSEIILIDDCSNNSFKEQNKNICEKETYIPLKKNIGRSAIRNLFLKYSKYDNLLFLDCDSLIISDKFLLNYVNTIKKDVNNVICGGRIYKKQAPKKDKMLRWKYGIKKESQPFEVRIKNPNRSFMTNNFLISRKIFETIQFDERLVEYGHEDTLFGFQLKKKAISITHIENTILNGDLEDNNTYIKNTEKAIYNLISILEYTNFDKDFINDIALLRIFNKVQKVKGIIKILFISSKPLLRYFLSKGYINLYLFYFYKLGTLTRKINTLEQQDVLIKEISTIKELAIDK